MIIKKRGKKKKVMRVTCLTPPVLLPGTGSEMALLNPSVWNLPTPKRSSHGSSELLSGVRVEGRSSTGRCNRAGADVCSFGRISLVSGPHLRISRRSPVLFWE